MGLSYSTIKDIGDVYDGIDIANISDETKYKGTVPDGTIKKGYDIYKDSNYRNRVSLDEVYGGGVGGTECGHALKPAADIFQSDDKSHNGQHRSLKCRKRAVGSGYDCGDCDFYPDDKEAKPDVISSYRVPIGLYLDSGGGSAGTNSKEESVACYPNEWDINRIGWGYGDYTNKDRWNPRVPDEVAIGCSGGANLKPDQYAKTYNGYKIKHDNRYTENDPKTPDTDDCWLGPTQINSDDNVVCLKSGVDWPTYCQLGDNIKTSGCQERCKPTIDKPDPPDYCKFAFNRYCKVKKGDPYKRDPVTGEILYSTTNNIVNVSDLDVNCKDYCGTAGSDKCIEIKDDICSRPADFLKHDWLPEYCKDYWKGNPDNSIMSKTCKDVMLDKDSGQSVLSGKGCDKLCTGYDIDKDWCDSLRGEYCTSSDANMLSEKCYQFCSTSGNENYCSNYLLGIDGETGMCSRLGAHTEEDLNKIVDGTNRQISDWCGCMMPSKYYSDFVDKTTGVIKDQGYVINGQIDIHPECMYPLCSKGSIRTTSQQSRIDNGECKGCVQIMLSNATDSNISNSNFAQNQSLVCTNDEITTNETSTTNIKNSQDISLELENHYKTLPDKLSAYDPRSIIELIFYCLVILGLIVASVYFLFFRKPAKI